MDYKYLSFRSLFSTFGSVRRAYLLDHIYMSFHDKQLKSGSAKHIDAEILAKHKKKERELAKQGKRPFYLKKSEIRKQRFIEKYKHLKSSGKLEAFVEKRRSRNAAKDHRYMPYRRHGRRHLSGYGWRIGEWSVRGFSLPPPTLNSTTPWLPGEVPLS